MTYIKTQWNNDNLPAIDADNLNKIEDGIESIDTAIEGHLVNVAPSVDEDYKVNVLYSTNLLDYNKKNSSSANYTIAGDKLTLSANGQIYIELPTEVGKTYTLSYETNNGFASVRASDYNGGSWVEYGRTTEASNGKVTFTATSNLAIISCNGGTANSSYVTKLQVNTGSTTLPFEPFVQKSIQVDGTKFTDTLNVGTSVDSGYRVNFLKGKNILNETFVTGIGLDTSSGNTYSANNRASTNFVEVKPNTEYTISGCTLVVVCCYSSSQSFLGYVTTTTFTTLNDTKFIRICVNSNNSYSSTMLELGSTATTYEPYITPTINVDGDEIYNSNIMNYSTSEQRIGTWIDDKPIYRKTVDFGTLPNATTKSVAHNISNLKHFLKIEGIAWVDDSQLNTLPIPATATDNLIYQVFISCDKTNINIKTGSNRTSFTKCYVILEYTKTTD